MEEDRLFVSAPLVTIGEAAKFLGVGRKVVYQLIEYGQIRAVRLGRALRTELASLQNFKSSGKMI
jgi:excisionase family DNA binding protein